MHLPPPDDMDAIARMFDYEAMKAQAGDTVDVPGFVATVIHRIGEAAPNAWQAHAQEVLGQVKRKLHAAELPEELLPFKLADPMQRRKIEYLRQAAAQLETAITGSTAARGRRR